MPPESPAPCRCGHLLGMMHFMSYSQEWPWRLLFFPSRFAQGWLWKFILLKDRTPVLIGLIVSPPLSFPSPRTGCYSFGSAENPVRFCSSTTEKIKLNALCTLGFQIPPCQLSFFIFLGFFCLSISFLLVSFLFYTFYWSCLFLASDFLFLHSVVNIVISTVILGQ